MEKAWQCFSTYMLGKKIPSLCWPTICAPKPGKKIICAGQPFVYLGIFPKFQQSTSFVSGILALELCAMSPLFEPVLGKCHPIRPMMMQSGHGNWTPAPPIPRHVPLVTRNLQRNEEINYVSAAESVENIKQFYDWFSWIALFVFNFTFVQFSCSHAYCDLLMDALIRKSHPQLFKYLRKILRAKTTIKKHAEVWRYI